MTMAEVSGLMLPEHLVEVEVDAVSDGERVLIPGIMEQIERAGVHSGDAMCVYPGITLTDSEVNTVVEYTGRIGTAMGFKGLINVQFIVMPSHDQGIPAVYVLEVNPRSSRTIPFISKVTGVPMVRLAVNAMLGFTLREQGYQGGLWKKQKLVGVKAPVFSMSKLAGVDTYLGPEMKSTGEVMGIDTTFDGAVTKALLGSGLNVPEGEAVLLSIADPDKADALGLVRTLNEAGHQIYATGGTAEMIRAMGIEVSEVEKRLQEGSGRTVVDIIEDGTVSAVVNTVTGDRSTMQDGFHIRRAAAMQRIPCFTSLDQQRRQLRHSLPCLDAGQSPPSSTTVDQ